jgi:phosphoglycolate phosphatase
MKQLLRSDAMQVSAVIFDLDGTLIDSAGDLQSAVNRMLEDFRCARLSPVEFRGMFGDGAGALIARVLAARPGCLIDHAAALKRFLEHYETDLTTLTHPYPGVQETLDVLHRRGMKLAVCTNKATALTRTILQRLSLEGYFTRVVGGDGLPFRKPDPRVLFEVLTKLQIPAASSVLVGDSEVDAATAKAAGVPFVLMTHGYHRGPVGEIPCVIALDHFEQLETFLGGS